MNNHGQTRMNARRALLCALGAAVLMGGALLPSVSYAQAQAKITEKDPVEIHLTQMRVVVEDGKERLVPVDKVKPGDVIEYRAVYANTSNKPVRGVVATVPVPMGLVYAERSAHAEGARAELATNELKFGSEPLMRVVPGKKELEKVPYAEYRAARWKLAQLDAGKKFEARVRATVNTASTAAPAQKPVVEAVPSK